MSNKIAAVLATLIVIGTMGGYYFGNNQGYRTGHIIGYSEGQEYGYKTGYSNGTEDGYDKGYSTGFSLGDASGYTRGHSTGYNDGNAKGYLNGYSVGREHGYNTGYSNGNSTGYAIGYSDGWATTGFNIRDPTYSEMISFIATDRTDDNNYVDTSYVCHDFSYDVKTNAFNAGYRCFWVGIEMGDHTVQTGHAIVAFNTTDRGIIYIEPQSDRVMNVQIGKPYWDRSRYSAPSYDDTVTKIELIP
ncbi:MAG: hypothetical protein Q8O47_09595 [Candidatus Bathyarchaeota archaeon]|nr:hypothetical protein [Candidatus Bathyarchaeota archaeon]